MNKKQEEIFNLILEERKRQEEIHPNWLNIGEVAVSLLTEELGEFAQAINDGNIKEAKKEVIQVASLCFRYLEGLEK